MTWCPALECCGGERPLTGSKHMHGVWLVVPPLSVLVFVTSITPGPNNIMLMLSGTRFGLRATLPHLFGVASGFCLLVVMCCAGVGALVAAYPVLRIAMGVACGVYLLWLAAALLRKRPPTQEQTGSSAP